MIAFASSITAQDVYDRCARRGFETSGVQEEAIFSEVASGSIFRSYNSIIDKARARDDLEALVLVHQDAEIVDHDFCAKLRAALSGDGVGLVGCVGAVGVRSIAWWEGSTTWGSFVHRYEEFGGGEFPAFSWSNDALPPYARTGEVEMIDGFVLCLAPWVIQNIRFDESLGLALHGYDFDFCQQVRETGHKVVTADFKVIHHHSLKLVSDPETYIESYMKVAEKWEGRIANRELPSREWKPRALRAEAEAAAARAQALGARAEIVARERRNKSDYEAVRASTSLRLAAGVRLVGDALKRTAGMDVALAAAARGWRRRRRRGR